MALPPDVLAERARLKKESRRWRVLAFAALFGGLLLFGLVESQDLTRPSNGYIARIKIEGFIGDDIKRDKMLEELTENDNVKAVLIRMDSPGGTALGGEELHRQLLDLSSKKPVITLMRTACTSACYMAAIGTNRLYALDSSITGSIGVLLEMAEVTELAKKLGIEPISVRSGELKATPSPFQKFKPEDREYIQSVVNNSFSMFMDMVTSRRKLTAATTTLISDGRIFTGRQAIEINLIDAIGGEKEAVQWLEKDRKLAKDMPIRDVEPKKEPKEWLANLEQSAKGLIFGSFTQRLDGLVSIWQPVVK